MTRLSSFCVFLMKQYGIKILTVQVEKKSSPTLGTNIPVHSFISFIHSAYLLSNYDPKYVPDFDNTIEDEPNKFPDLLELTLSWGDRELTSKQIRQVILIYDKCYEGVWTILHRVAREGL